MTGSQPAVKVESGDLTVTVTLNRPDRRNAVNHDVLHALLDALGAAQSGGCRALVLQGAGGNFCSGADLGGVEDETFVDLLRRVLVGLRDAPFPTIAAVEGYALGAGTQLATACDLRVAQPDATFGVPAAKLGLTVDWWTVRRVVAMCGEATARAMFLAAETVTGADAHRTGYVQRLGSPADARSWADEIVQLAPLTIQAHKVMLNRLEDDTAVDPQVEVARLAAWSSDDLQEGLAAFRDRRPPSFEGR